MNGDWEFGQQGDVLPRFARAVLDFTDGTRLVLVDSRALGTLDLHDDGAALDLGLGPDAADPALTAAHLAASLARRRGPVKPALLDQKVIAGLGNIYAAESLWRARIDPRRPAASLTRRRSGACAPRSRRCSKRASGSRYTDDDTVRLDVYDREGRKCRRCSGTVSRITQAGRSTFSVPPASDDARGQSSASSSAPLM